MIYLIVNKETGEFHERDCLKCGVFTISGETLDNSTLLFQQGLEDSLNETHALREVTPKEHDDFCSLVYEFERDGKLVSTIDPSILTLEERDSATIKRPFILDLSSQSVNVKDRKQVDDLSNPVEIDGIGGKEIIGFEQKPESIVIERSDPIIKAESELEK
ncbi:MAG TPA: hypothetical protein VHC46_07690 [Thermodesulfobacteriota bacterium]|nr:hypothetical protein [Thermodesulfobacteriota bacterium]